MNDDPDSSTSDSLHITIAVTVQATAWLDALPEAEALARRAALAALCAAGGSPKEPAETPRETEVSLVLASDAGLRRLNRDYRGKDRPTNVLSFPIDGEETPEDGGLRLLGDVVLAFETVQAETREQGKPLGDHLSHLVVHGVLHLLGYDHTGEADAAAMERLETGVLAGLGIADPYDPATARAAALPG
ncbi:MAG: rRNA maturation RNase YbeY [Kiloniellales bacterium]